MSLLLTIVAYVLILLVWKYTQRQGVIDARAEYDRLVQQAEGVLAQYGPTSLGYDSSSNRSSGPSSTSSSSRSSSMVTHGNIRKELSALAKLQVRGAEGSSSMQLSAHKDVVLGMAMNTDPKNFVVFCASLRKVSNADAYIFVNTPVDLRIKEIAERYHVSLGEFDVTSDPVRSKYHPSTLRWALMKSYLEQSDVKGTYGRVWMIDVRDSMFQSDPFKMLPQYRGGPSSKPVFLAFRGVEDFKIVECGWNGGWVKDCFGKSMLARIGNNYIICSGVSAGTIDAVLPYLDKMAAITTGTNRPDLPLHEFPRCERNGVDQGVHNVLVHTKGIRGLKVLGQAQGPVANMQAKVGQVRGDFSVVNSKGDAYAVVHQYDRAPTLQRHLFKSFVYWTNTDDPMQEWRETTACTKFDFKQNVDLFRARCDLSMQGGATGPATCCKLCSKQASCKAFTFARGTCFLKRCGLSDNGVVTGSNSMPGALSAWVK